MNFIVNFKIIDNKPQNFWNSIHRKSGNFVNEIKENYRTDKELVSHTAVFVLYCLMTIVTLASLHSPSLTRARFMTVLTQRESELAFCQACTFGPGVKFEISKRIYGCNLESFVFFIFF